MSLMGIKSRGQWSRGPDMLFLYTLGRCIIKQFLDYLIHTACAFSTRRSMHALIFSNMPIFLVSQTCLIPAFSRGCYHPNRDENWSLREGKQNLDIIMVIALQSIIAYLNRSAADLQYLNFTGWKQLGKNVLKGLCVCVCVCVIGQGAIMTKRSKNTVLFIVTLGLLFKCHPLDFVYLKVSIVSQGYLFQFSSLMCRFYF